MSLCSICAKANRQVRLDNCVWLYMCSRQMLSAYAIILFNYKCNGFSVTKQIFSVFFGQRRT